MDTLLPTMDMLLPSGYAVMDMFLPTMDMLLPSGYAVMDMFLLNCGYASTRISHGGYAPMNMLLPPMDMSGGYDISTRKQHQDEL
jgi:hypothetical protein